MQRCKGARPGPTWHSFRGLTGSLFHIQRHFVFQYTVRMTVSQQATDGLFPPIHWKDVQEGMETSGGIALARTKTVVEFHFYFVTFPPQVKVESFVCMGSSCCWNADFLVSNWKPLMYSLSTRNWECFLIKEIYSVTQSSFLPLRFLVARSKVVGL